MPVPQRILPTLTIEEKVSTLPGVIPQLPIGMLLQEVPAYVVSACLNAIVKLKIPDRLGTGSKHIDRLAKETGASPGYLFRILRALETRGLFHQTSEMEFALSPSGLTLRSNVESSLSATTEWLTDEMQQCLYNELHDNAAKAQATSGRIYGAFTDWLARSENADDAKVFHEAMTGFNDSFIPSVLEAYDFKPFQSTVNVGGGHAALMSAILKVHQNMSAKVANCASFVIGAQTAMDRRGLAARCEVVECNFFESVPAGADLYLLKDVFSDWDDESASCILQTLRRAIA